MMRIFKIRRDEQGAAVIELAIALPVLIMIIFGMFEAALLLKASAGMQHAIGEGARRAMIYPTPNSTAVATEVNESLFGMENAKSGYPQVSAIKSSNTTHKWYTISVTYKKDVTFMFLPSREVTISHSKRVYTAQ